MSRTKRIGASPRARFGRYCGDAASVPVAPTAQDLRPFHGLVEGSVPKLVDERRIAFVRRA